MHGVVKQFTLTLIRRLVSLIDWMTWRAGLLLGTSRTYSGVKVVVIANERDVSRCFENVAEALGVIERFDTRRVAALRRRVALLLVTENDGSAYIPTLNAGLLSLNLVLTRSAEEIAVTIVHEMTHARLWQRGFRYAAAKRERIERICVGEEMRFAARLPGGSELVKESERLLTSRWWEYAGRTKL